MNNFTIDNIHLFNMDREYIYPKWTTPKPGPGLRNYMKRLDKFVCPESISSTSNEKEPCPLEQCIEEELRYLEENHCKPKDNTIECLLPTCRKEALPIYPSERPKHHRLSFVDDPPYTDVSQFNDDEHYKKVQKLSMISTVSPRQSPCIPKK